MDRREATDRMLMCILRALQVCPHNPEDQDRMLSIGRDAFERALEQAGYVIVPKLATEIQVNAALDEYAANSPYESPLGPDGAFARQYAAMISAGGPSETTITELAARLQPSIADAMTDQLQRLFADYARSLPKGSADTPFIYSHRRALAEIAVRRFRAMISAGKE